MQIPVDPENPPEQHAQCAPGSERSQPETRSEILERNRLAQRLRAASKELQRPDILCQPFDDVPLAKRFGTNDLRRPLNRSLRRGGRRQLGHRSKAD